MNRFKFFYQVELNCVRMKAYVQMVKYLQTWVSIDPEINYM